MRKLKIAAVVLGALLVLLLLVVKFVLLTGGELPEKARFALDLNALREAAGPLEACPESAHAENVARAQMPLPIVIAGGDFKTVTFGFYSWQLRYGDGSSVVLDAVQSKGSKDGQPPPDFYDDAAWGRQEAALAAASTIAVTHEHYDHLGGVSDSKQFATLAQKLKLNPAQKTKSSFGGISADLSSAGVLESGPEGSLHKVAPGVVAVSAPGHTAGSQMFYVRLKSGPEFLLIGDICWQNVNLEKGISRPRLLAMMGEDSVAIVHETRAIIDFQKANPSVDVVVAHDVAAMERRFQSGTVVKGF